MISQSRGVSSQCGCSLKISGGEPGSICFWAWIPRYWQACIRLIDLFLVELMFSAWTRSQLWLWKQYEFPAKCPKSCQAWLSETWPIEQLVQSGLDLPSEEIELKVDCKGNYMRKSSLCLSRFYDKAQKNWVSWRDRVVLRCLRSLWARWQGWIAWSREISDFFFRRGVWRPTGTLFLLVFFVWGRPEWWRWLLGRWRSTGRVRCTCWCLGSRGWFLGLLSVRRGSVLFIRLYWGRSAQFGCDGSDVRGWMPGRRVLCFVRWRRWYCANFRRCVCNVRVVFVVFLRVFKTDRIWGCCSCHFVGHSE